MHWESADALPRIDRDATGKALRLGARIHAVEPIDVPVDGVDRLRLVVTDVGDNHDSDVLETARGRRGCC